MRLSIHSKSAMRSSMPAPRLRYALFPTKTSHFHSIWIESICSIPRHKSEGSSIMSTLSLEKVTKRFRSDVSLNKVSLGVQAGEFVVLLGRTGVGKAALLRCVAGVEKMDSGDVLIGGENVKAQAPAERDLAFVFQNYALYP